MMQPPEVDLLVPRSPPQSESLYPLIVVGLDCHEYTYTRVGYLVRYLPNLFSEGTSLTRGFVIALEISFAA